MLVTAAFTYEVQAAGPCKKEFLTIENKPTVASETTTSPQNTHKQNLKISQ